MEKCTLCTKYNNQETEQGLKADCACTGSLFGAAHLEISLWLRLDASSEYWS